MLLRPGSPEEFSAFVARQTPVWTEMVRIAAGATWTTSDARARQLVFVVRGAGMAGAERIGPYDTIQIQPAEAGVIRADEEMELFLMGLPPVIVPHDASGEFEYVEGLANDSAIPDDMVPGLYLDALHWAAQQIAV